MTQLTERLKDVLQSSIYRASLMPIDERRGFIKELAEEIEQHEKASIYRPMLEVACENVANDIRKECKLRVWLYQRTMICATSKKRAGELIGYSRLSSEWDEWKLPPPNATIEGVWNLNDKREWMRRYDGQVRCECITNGKAFSWALAEKAEVEQPTDVRNWLLQQDHAVMEANASE